MFLVSFFSPVQKEDGAPGWQESADVLQAAATYVEVHALRAVEREGGEVRRQRDVVVIGTHAQRQTAKRLLLVARHGCLA